LQSKAAARPLLTVKLVRAVLDRDVIARRYERVRALTEALMAPLSAEDAMVQSMPDASPAKWHAAHTTWFFEEFVLARFEPGHRWRDERWRVLFNSYYEGVGERHPRGSRGVLSRPSLDEVRAWRASVDERVRKIVARADETALDVVLLGTHHEEQHQELLLTDIKHAMSSSELRPAYAPQRNERNVSVRRSDAAEVSWISREEAVVRAGYGGDGFAFDNELGEHSVLVGAFALASRLVTNAEYAAFIEDAGYDRPELWLADGWAAAKSNAWRAPLYWERFGGQSWRVFGMHGMESLDAHAPVAHVSFFEADAYARWAGARLPTEYEWDSVAREVPIQGVFVEGGSLAPRPVGAELAEEDAPGVRQLFGDAWEWTASAYLPYPRFRPRSGSLGEYNGKFMSGQMVLRGGSCVTPQPHIRATYRNFFPPETRWQFSGIRLAS
jgi:ergothioneine biosynthesis protein EgtB